MARGSGGSAAGPGGLAGGTSELGHLYTPTDPPPRGQSFEGVAGRDLSNPLPSWMAGNSVPVGIVRERNTPAVNPGEEWQRVNTQLYGEIRPRSNLG